MAKVRRVYVQKRKGFDVAAQHLMSDLRAMLGIRGITGLSILNRYDVSGISDEDWKAARDTILAEKAVDALLNHLPKDGAQVFAVEYLPGQYDQRADSAAQCIQLLSQGEAPVVRNAVVYMLYGTISDEEMESIKKYIINPVDSREALLELPESLEMETTEPADVAVMDGFIALDRQGIASLHNDLGLAMSVEDLLFVQNYFSHEEQRNPTISEIRVIDTYWSDHCRHTTFLTQLTDVNFAQDAIHQRGAWEEYLAARGRVFANRTEKPISLMDLATIAPRDQKMRGLLDDLDESDEINACSIVRNVDIDGVEQEYLVQFKNETHNHPTEIEPFGGAATCLGGAIRDPLSGRAYVYQAMRVTGSADPRAAVEDTLPGKLPQRKLTQGAAAGYSSYGNQIGLATGQVTEIYHPGYMAKRMEIGAVVGAVRRDAVRREEPRPGDVVILLGGRTGRDGCGGATGSSKAHTEQSIETCGAEVQKGNPPTERKLQRLFRHRDVVAMIKRCNDFGAGGVCVAIGELADGLKIDLDKVPRKYEGLDGTELAISESQERMAVVVEEVNVHAFLKAAAAENLEATPVAVVRETPRMTMTWRGKTIIDISRAFLDTNGAPQFAKAHVSAGDVTDYFAPGKDDPGKLQEELAKLNVCSQRGLTERFDASIGAGTVLMPFGGKYQLTPVMAMAAKIPLETGKTDTCTLMAHGFDPDLSTRSPFHGAVYAVLESLNRIAAAGGDISACRLTFQEYFERLGEKPERWGKPLAALLGAFTAQQALDVAAIGGKDSMSGSFGDMDVPPTLVSFALCTARASQVVSPEFKRSGSRIILLEEPINPDGLPDFARFRKNCAAVYDAVQKGRVLSAHTVGEGGVAAAVAKMTLGNGIGAEIMLKGLYQRRIGSLVLEMAEGGDSCFAGLDWQEIGRTGGEKLVLNSQALELEALQSSWEAPLEGVFATESKLDGEIKSKTCPLRYRLRTEPVIAQPRVVIPVFPGTNCEYDVARAFREAGAKVETIVLRNLDAVSIQESTQELAKAISNSQIFMIPGGFSAGDEPDGSGKFIATVLREARVSEALMELLHHRDGLALGVCNGFQALIKVGLVPYGDIRPMRDDSPTLTFNAIGRHQSRIVSLKVCSVKSPWFAALQPDDIYNVAISHGEGRFVCSEEEYDRLLANGQIATQYVDLSGHPTYDCRFNPNGSMHAVEGILSPDGRVLGKMGHDERSGQDVFRNVPGRYDSGIYASGVRYFL